jgi:hypothetical protein
MAPLKNQRHERFCVALAEGKSADAAYVEAGFQENRGNASRLKANESIRGRLAELQAEAAQRSEITIDTICRELDQACAVARAKGQASAMVSASSLRAKLGGLLIERVEVGSPNEFAGCNTEAATVDRLIEIICGETPDAHFTAQDRDKLLEMMTAVGEFINSCKAKPVPGPVRPSQRAIELQRPRLNGRHRY